MLMVRIVVRIEVAEGANRLKQCGMGFGRKFLNGWRQQDATAKEGAAEVVIEGTNPVGFGGAGCGHAGLLHYAGEDGRRCRAVGAALVAPSTRLVGLHLA